MSNVALTIGGRRFTVACAPGEEAHIAALGETIDAKLRAIGGAAGQSETRMLLFAALLLADELHERAAGADETHGARADALDSDFGDRLAGIAERLENLAARLEREPADA